MPQAQTPCSLLAMLGTAVFLSSPTVAFAQWHCADAPETPPEMMEVGECFTSERVCRSFPRGLPCTSRGSVSCFRLVVRSISGGDRRASCFVDLAHCNIARRWVASLPNYTQTLSDCGPPPDVSYRWSCEENDVCQVGACDAECWYTQQRADPAPPDTAWCFSVNTILGVSTNCLRDRSECLRETLGHGPRLDMDIHGPRPPCRRVGVLEQARREGILTDPILDGPLHRGQRCSGWPECDEGLRCGSRRAGIPFTCMPCGTVGQVPCRSTTHCEEWHREVGRVWIWEPDGNGTIGICRTCGGRGQMCCFDHDDDENRCRPGLSCDLNGRCR